MNNKEETTGLVEITRQNMTPAILGYEETVMTCPKCGGKIVNGRIGCPDNMPGCLVLHYVYTCWDCGTDFKLE